MRRVDLVVFDLDGTLIDSAGDLARAVNAALERLAPGTPAIPLDRVRTFIGDGAAMLVSRTLGAAGVSVSTEEALPGIPPEAAVLVGDSAIDVRTGRAAGVRTVGVTYGLDPAGLEAMPPDVLIADLSDLAPRLSPPFAG